MSQLARGLVSQFAWGLVLQFASCTYLMSQTAQYQLVRRHKDKFCTSATTCDSVGTPAITFDMRHMRLPARPD